jgi:hypothetical protein
MGHQDLVRNRCGSASKLWPRTSTIPTARVCLKEMSRPWSRDWGFNRQRVGKARRGRADIGRIEHGPPDDEDSPQLEMMPDREGKVNKNQRMRNRATRTSCPVARVAATASHTPGAQRPGVERSGATQRGMGRGRGRGRAGDPPPSPSATVARAPAVAPAAGLLSSPARSTRSRAAIEALGTCLSSCLVYTR